MNLKPLFLRGGHKTTIQTLNEHVLVLWRGTSQNLQTRQNLIELSRGEFAEVLANHGDAVIMKDTGLLGNGHCSIKVVSGDHSDEDTSLLAGGDSLDDVRSQRIGNTDKSIQTHFLLQLFRTLSDCAIGHIDDGVNVITVAKRNAPEGRGGVFLDRRLDFGALGRRQLLSRAIRIQVRGAVLQNGLGRTLVVQGPAHLSIAGGWDATIAI
mmetsp:Transcript_33730/g.99386  ORF Transcript_33730/g.99386 Transcript_33730/m.99386 type:complete len:210 (+) Transcript_33730:1089-1718(+)